MKKKLIILTSICAVFLSVAVLTGRWSFYTDTVSFIDSRVWIRCKVAHNDWGPWMDPFDNMRKDFYSNVASGKGKLLFSYGEVPIYLYSKYQEILKSCDESGISQKDCKVEDKILTTMEYTHGKELVRDICLSLNKSTELAQFKVMSFWPKSIKERNLKKRWGYVQEYTFPPEKMGPNFLARTK